MMSMMVWQRKVKILAFNYGGNVDNDHRCGAYARLMSLLFALSLYQLQTFGGWCLLGWSCQCNICLATAWCKIMCIMGA